LRDSLATLRLEMATKAADADRAREYFNAELLALRQGNAVELARLQTENEILRDSLPRWYEKPAFVATVTAVLVIVAVVKSLQFSLSGTDGHASLRTPGSASPAPT